MTNAKRLFYNTLALTAVNILLRGVGVSFNVYLTSRVGSAGIGLFQLIMTVYGMGITFSAFGINLAATRLTADNNGKYSNKNIMFYCLAYALFFGTSVGALLYFGSDLAAGVWIHDVRAKKSLKILALSLPFVSMSSALGGYFTAVRRVIKHAAVRIAEEFFCIASTVLLLNYYAPKGLEYACFAMSLGACLSEFVSFMSSYSMYRFELRGSSPVQRHNELIKKLLHIALPDGIGACTRSILLTVEHLLIPVGFRKSGLSGEGAMATYGMLHGMVLPVLLFPSAVLNALSGLLIPEIAELNAKGLRERIRPFAERILRLTSLFAMITAAVFYAYAPEFSQSLYRTDSAAPFFQILAPLVVFMYLDMTVDGILKGLDQQVYSMRYNILDSSLCVILVYILIPKYAVKGYIIVLYVSEIINFYLSMQRLIKVAELKFNLFRAVLLPAVCAVLSTVLFYKLPLKLVTGIIFSIGLYVMLIFALRICNKEDVRWALRAIK